MRLEASDALPDALKVPDEACGRSDLPEALKLPDEACGRSDLPEALKLPDGAWGRSDYKPFEPPSAEKMSPLQYFLADKVEVTPTLRDLLDSELTPKSNSLCEDIAVLSQQTDGWKDCGTKEGVKLFRRSKDLMVRGFVELPSNLAAIDSVVQFLWAESSPTSYDKTVEASSRLATVRESAEAGLAIMYQSYNAQFGYNGRDFIMSAAKRKMSSKHSVIVSKSLDDDLVSALYPPTSTMSTCTSVVSSKGAPPAPLLKDRVRGFLHIGGYDIREVRPGVIRLTCLWNVDVKAPGVPSMIMMPVTLNSCLLLAKLMPLLGSHLAACKALASSGQARSDEGNE